MMQVTVWLSSLADDSQKTWQARWSEQEHSECFVVHAPDAACCMQGESEMSVIVS